MVVVAAEAALDRAALRVAAALEERAAASPPIGLMLLRCRAELLILALGQEERQEAAAVTAPAAAVAPVEIQP